MVQTVFPLSAELPLPPHKRAPIVAVPLLRDMLRGVPSGEYRHGASLLTGYQRLLVAIVDKPHLDTLDGPRRDGLSSLHSRITPFLVWWFPVAR